MSGFILHNQYGLEEKRILHFLGNHNIPVIISNSKNPVIIENLGHSLATRWEELLPHIEDFIFGEVYSTSFKQAKTE